MDFCLYVKKGFEIVMAQIKPISLMSLDIQGNSDVFGINQNLNRLRGTLFLSCIFHQSAPFSR